MPSTFTANKQFELQATGENNGTWGSKADTVFTNIDAALAGRTALSVAGNSDVTLTGAQALNIYHRLTGALTGNINYIFPAGYTGYYLINNLTSGAFTITVKPLGGTGVVCPQGAVVEIFIDPDNTAAVLIGLDDPGGNGLVVRTGPGTVTQRSLVAPAAGIAIANPDGVAAAPTFSLANDLAAVEGLGSTGIAVRSAADTWVQRTIAGTAPIALTNGDGVAGNPTVSANVASAADFRSNVATKLLQTDNVWSAADYVGLTDAAPIAVDMNNGFNFTVTLNVVGATRQLGNPTNTKNGEGGIIEIKQDGSGNRAMTYGANWKFAGGTAPVLTTTASARDLLAYQVISATVIYATLIKDVK